MNQRKIDYVHNVGCFWLMMNFFHVDSCGDGHSVEKNRKKRLSGALLMHY